MKRRALIVLLSAALLGAAPAPPPGGGRIIGGKLAPEGTAPWQVEIVRHSHIGGAPFLAHRCGGTIIDAAWILTATHCLLDDEHHNLMSEKNVIEVFEVRAGSVLRDGPDMKAFKIDRVVPHPDWISADAHPARFDNFADIALIHITPAAIMPGSDPKRFRKALLPTSDDTTTEAMVTGWGATKIGRLPTTQLQYATVTIIPLDECATANGNQPIDPTILCAWHKADADAPDVDDHNARGTCQGDSGGPLVVRRRTAWVVVGVVSRGIKCGEYPARYTRVASYLPWITATIGSGT